MTKYRREMFDWNGDNSGYVLNELIPALKLSARDKAHMTMAYWSGAEKTSDGKTFAEDVFMGGLIKSPAGVSHDYINRVYNHTTPDGKVWTPWQANALFRRILKALWQYETDKKHDLNKITRTLRWIRGWRMRWREWLAVTVLVPWWWRGTASDTI